MSKVCKIAIVVTATVVAGLGFTHAGAKEALAWKIDHRELKLFRQTMQQIQEDYAGDVKDKELIQGAIDGMLRSLDPHSSYLTQDLLRELQYQTEPEFGGLGIEIVLEDGILTVVTVIEASPAAKAGLTSGDKIIGIGGESARNMTLMQAVKKMRGARGTKVTITVAREGKQPQDYTVTRDVIHVQSIKTQILEKGYPYIKLVSFRKNTVEDLAEAVRKAASRAQVKGLVLDLRNNPGGLLDEAWKVANLFVESGLIVYTDGRSKDQRMEFRATSGDHFRFKVAVLINGGSASASEIVAGCLQDHQRALLFGTQSFGKASVQTIIPLENGGALRLTTAYYYTPSGRHIQKKGIQPDVDMKSRLETRTDSEAADLVQEKPPKTKQRQSWRTVRVDPAKDLTLSEALRWLKSDQSVQEFRNEQERKAAHDAARTL
ncbi:MAG: S41 family peptidase [Thermodesulfobacteriota bacterium]